jgi:hypothetical protein
MVEVQTSEVSLAQQWVGIGFPWLQHIPSSADATMETKVCTSEMDAIPAPYSLA